MKSNYSYEKELITHCDACEEIRGMEGRFKV